MDLTRNALLFVAMLAGLAGCARHAQRPPPQVQVAVLPEEGVPTDWRRVADAADRGRIDALDTTWAAALADAARTDAAALKQEGDLLQPAVALPAVTPTPGLYSCRSVRLGQPVPRLRTGRGFARFKAFDCVVTAEGAQLSFTKIGGTNRPGGYLWPQTEQRMVFLGGTYEGQGNGASAYGGEPSRNRLGVIERYGEFRWRLVLLNQPPLPPVEIIDLVPAVAVAARPGR